jgi:hypothetical protein
MSNGSFVPVATGTVLGGAYIPAHDATFDIAEIIGRHLDAFRSYVAQVRDAEQADNAVQELLTAFLKEAQKRGTPPE